MIVYIDLEHDRLAGIDPVKWMETAASRLKTKYRLEELSGKPCLIMHYRRATPNLLEELEVLAVIVSGNTTDFEHYQAADLAGLQAIYRAGSWPMLAFCGGMQLMAAAYGGEIGPIGPLQPGDPAPPLERNPTPGLRQERGFMPISVHTPGIIFSDIKEKEPVVFQDHYWEIKKLPSEFVSLASSPLCPVQAIAHRTFPLFGTQFHPEKYDAQHPDGRQMIANFFAHIEVSSLSPFMPPLTDSADRPAG